MKKISLLLLTAVFLLTAVSAANAQFTIKIPKMPKIPKVVTNDSGGDSSGNGDSNAEVFESKYAAADYDANIRPGTRVAAYQNVGLVDGEVISRKGNVYKVHRTDGTNVDDLFRANSVYPFSIGDYKMVLYEADRADVTRYLVFLMDYYAKDASLTEKELDSSGKFKARFDNDFDRMKKEFDAIKPAMNKFRELFRARIPQPARTYLALDENPATLSGVLENYEKYMAQALSGLAPVAGQCGPLSDGDKARVRIYKEDLEKLLQQAQTFTKGRGWYSREFHENYLLAALSPSERSRMVTKYGKLYPCISDLFDQIQAAAKKTLPQYTPWSYNVKTPADVAVLKSSISDLNKATVFKAALQSNVWNIQKNSIGIPEKRYKYGAIWVKYPSSDTGFCQILWINVVQEYTGGGTWGQSYGIFTRNEPAGCPMGK